MKLKEHVPKTCPACQSRVGTLQEESYGCDGCRKPIDDLFGHTEKNHRDYLRLTVFYLEDRLYLDDRRRLEDRRRPADHFQFCSWRCVFKKLRMIKTDYFVDLPQLSYESDTLPGQGIKDFLKCVKKGG